MVLSFFLFFLGCFFLYKGGDYLVDGSAAIARHWHVSELFIGLTLVSLGTSLPEIIVSVFASLAHESDLVLGNILGSNISNTCLILGVTGLLCPLAIPHCRLQRECWYYVFIMILITSLLLLQGGTVIGPIMGVFLLVLAGIAIRLFFVPKDATTPQDSTPNPPHLPMKRAVIIMLLGCLFLPLGGHLLIDSARTIATHLGVSKAFISLFAIALGTSLPELITSIIAAGKGNSDLALGNIVGSNIFNITLVLGVSACLSPVAINPVFYSDALVVGVSLLPLAAVLFIARKPTVTKPLCWLYLLSYLLYCGFIYLR